MKNIVSVENEYYLSHGVLGVASLSLHSFLVCASMETNDGTHIVTRTGKPASPSRQRRRTSDMGEKYSEMRRKTTGKLIPVECYECFGYGILDNGSQCSRCGGSGDLFIEQKEP